VTDARPASAGEIPTIARSLAKAFHDDPVMLHMLRVPARRERQMMTFFATEMKRALKVGAVITADEQPAGAIWMAPGQWRMGNLQLLSFWPVMLSWRSALARSLRVLGRMEKVHPEEPHWYLAVLGTAPEHQGKGLGSAMMAPILQRCDDEGLPAYLESSKESNIAFYGRHGFEVVGEVVVPDGPTLWPMWRKPR
jgi:ribosomal protein S18 acetylase RimI-like enzyme